MAQSLIDEEAIFKNNESMSKDTFTVSENNAANQSKNKDGVLPCRCSVCHNIPKPKQVRIYYGHRFCHECFHKYIWSPPKAICSGDLKFSDMTLLKESCEISIPPGSS